MIDTRFTLFDTALGRCALVWGPAGLRGAHLPAADEPASRRDLQRRFPDAVEDNDPPPWIGATITAIRRLFQGEPEPLDTVPLDWSRVGAFDRRVLELTRRIPPGRTRTYGAVAAELGLPGAAREVGQALGRNPWPIVVPCHRVVGAGGRLVGFSAPGGTGTKRRMLAIENARTSDEPTLFDVAGR
ncbi:MAG: methylated-DNA--[protein]-cysteine S-methyltransferase [Geminicoccaceae bacterium]